MAAAVEQNEAQILDEMPQYKSTANQFIPCRSIREDPSPLNFKKLAIRVPSYEVKKGGIFSSDYAVFRIESDLPGEAKYKVHRKDHDFYTFRKLIKQQTPHILAPPLPIKNAKLTDKYLQKRRLLF